MKLPKRRMSTGHRSIGGSPAGYPLGQRPPGAAGAGDAEGVEAGTDVEVPQLRRLAEDEVAVRRERFRAIDQLLDAGGLRAPARGRAPVPSSARNGPSSSREA